MIRRTGPSVVFYEGQVRTWPAAPAFVLLDHLACYSAMPDGATSLPLRLDGARPRSPPRLQEENVDAAFHCSIPSSIVRSSLPFSLLPQINQHIGVRNRSQTICAQDLAPSFLALSLAPRILILPASLSPSHAFAS